MNVSEVVAQFLARSGVEHVFGYPGDPSVEFLEGARKQGIDFVLGMREGTAGLMAEAYGMITDRPGVALSTLGPGCTNLTNAVANAYLDRVPMFAISGQIDTKRRPTFTHQVVNHDQLFSGIAKWTTEIASHNVGHIMRKAHRVAMADRPGPVHLTTPADVVGATAVDDAVDIPPSMSRSYGLSLVSDEDADPFAMIRGARKPVVLFGLSAVRHDCGAALTKLADHFGAALVASPMAKGLVDETHPRFAGVLDMACNQLLWDFLNSGDLVLAVGFDAVELIKPWDVTPPTVHIDTIANTDQIYGAQTEFVGPIDLAIDAICAEVDPQSGWAESALADHRHGLKSAYEAGRVAGMLNPTDVINVVGSWAPTDCVATSDVGSHKLLVGQGWTTRQRKGLLMTNGLSSMGFSLPAAIVQKMITPQKEVICFTGDGGLAMVQSELRTASSMGLALKVVVFVDHSLNRIELKQMAKQYPSVGTTIDPIDIPKLASSMACEGVLVESEQELEATLAGSAPHDRPLVIGARISPEQYQAQF